MINSAIYSFFGRNTKGLLVAVMLASSLGHAASDSENSPRFDIYVDPAFVRYLDLFEHPPYLALAFENAGVEFSVSGLGKLFILDEHAAQLKGFNGVRTMHFSHREGAVFFYRASMMGVSIRVNIDVSALEKGLITVIFPGLPNNVLLNNFSKSVGEKIGMLANDRLQLRILKYFDEIAKKKPESRNEKEWMASQLILEGYNRRALGEMNGGSGSAARNNNNAELDWLLLLAMIAVLLSGVALWKYGRR